MMVSASPSVERGSAELRAPSSVEFLDASLAPDRKKWLDLWSSWPQRGVSSKYDQEHARRAAHSVDDCQARIR